VLLDEIGRGTSTFDGLSLAWAVAEYLHDSAHHSAKTLFATHYHELTDLADKLAGAKNYQIVASERDGEVVFLHRLERGRASKSYGIEVARLAGMPVEVLSRAREVLARLERFELDVFGEQLPPASISAAEPAVNGDGVLDAAARRAGRRRLAAQASLFDSANREVIEELRDMNLTGLSAADALEVLSQFQKRVL
jgi:DNA mismatch repair protein MutS